MGPACYRRLVGSLVHEIVFPRAARPGRRPGRGGGKVASSTSATDGAPWHHRTSCGQAGWVGGNGPNRAPATPGARDHRGACPRRPRGQPQALCPRAPCASAGSGFAEGADQIAVAACPPGWQIEAILPFPKQEYLRDFEASSAGDGRDVREMFEASLARADAVTQLELLAADDGDGEVARRDLGYAVAGGYLLCQIDVLIAVWDGKPPKMGVPGRSRARRTKPAFRWCGFRFTTRRCPLSSAHSRAAARPPPVPTAPRPAAGGARADL